jgi:hypothetical protein
MAEDLLALAIPVIKPYRCHACNWRGYMGVVVASRDRIANLWINALGYLAILAGLIAFIISILSERS